MSARTSLWTCVVAVLAATWVPLVATLTVHAAGNQKAPPPSPTVPGPLYTEAQARRGENLVKQYCVVCHREDLQSGEVDMGLSGPHFLEHWGVTSLGDIAHLIQSTMPEDNPDILTFQQATDIVALILWQNYYPVGPRELPADFDALRRIVLQTREAHIQLFLKYKK